MKSAVARRSIVICVSLEDTFWNGLQEIAHREDTHVNTLVEQIDRDHTGVNLSSAIRVFVFKHLHAAPEVLALKPIASREVTDAEANRY
ncbi:MAG: ribbon-helix-helix domain-containing protein [Pseudolabrys sp.]